MLLGTVAIGYVLERLGQAHETLCQRGVRRWWGRHRVSSIEGIV